MLRIEPAELKSPDTRVQAEAMFDFASFRFDSEWRIAHQSSAGKAQPLPPVRLVFAGPIYEFSSVKPQLYADQFERFLTIKRMDADMERLEKLNEQRGIPRGSGTSLGPQAGTGESGAVSSGQSATQDSSGRTIPTQSLLNAPSVDLNEPKSSPATAARGGAGKKTKPATAEPSDGSWSTGVETAPEPSSDVWQQEPQAAQEAPGDFESQIREVLRSQSN